VQPLRRLFLVPIPPQLYLPVPVLPTHGKGVGLALGVEASPGVAVVILSSFIGPV
jgi:hypothetical protein